MKMVEPALRSLPGLLARNAAENGTVTFLSDADTALSRAQVWERAQSTASGFLALGLQRGDRVAVMLDNTLDFVCAWFGLATAGLVEVPLNPASRGDRLVHAMTNSEATVVVTDSNYVKEFEQIADRLPKLRTVVVTNGSAVTTLETVPFAQICSAAICDLPSITNADTAAIMYTSGSTGPAKGVVVPHGQHYMNGWQATRQAEISAEDRIFVTLPLHHNMAQGYGVMAGVVSGAGIHISAGFTRGTFWDEVISSGSTVFPFVGSIIALLAALQGPANNPLRVAYGVPVPPALHEEFERRFGLRLIDGYGSTEATIPAWGSLRGDRAIGSAGHVTSEFEVAILDGHDVPLTAGHIGEIGIRSCEPHSMFSGYFREPERTAKAMRNSWYHSGDRGRFDEQGNLWFEGRIDDVIRRFGEFITAKEVEDAIVKHDAVELVAAYGVATDVAGEEVVVAVVLKSGRLLTPEELRTHAEAHLPRFAVPRFIELVDELPTTPTGKVEKHKLRSRPITAATFDARQNDKATS
jgi:carnitine-CoA ligase